MNRSLINNPKLYQVNTRVWLTELSQVEGRRITLDEVPDSELDRIAEYGFEWVWMLSVWKTGREGQRISRETPQWRKDYLEILHDLKEEDIEGSGFAIAAYSVSEKIGGDEALARFRKRLNQRGIKLMLDFVPNHAGPDHHWVSSNPEFFITGTETDLERAPSDYMKVKSGDEELILAHGRDPYFPGWPDTLQLNYGNHALQKAMSDELHKISQMCDGVRCDMAMLINPEVFKRTWGINCKPFWPEAIKRIKSENPGFCFLAEVYWDMEWNLLQQGFDFTYDKRLYDRLKDGPARPVREHLFAGADYQSHMARFLENHDEPRAAKAFADGRHEAAAVITFLTPGMKFFHQGQLTGKKIKISAHLARGPEEPVNNSLRVFYENILSILRFPEIKNGWWQMVSCYQAWEGNRTYDNYISFSWQNEAKPEFRLLMAVNFSNAKSQCYVNIPFKDLAGKSWILEDIISGTSYIRSGDELISRGLYLDEPAWKSYIFKVKESQ